ncbi:FAD-binding oxidoreductase, partial [Candidatus Parcubacteria bacterium]|nr:FAD-binding oxidoreductase [Candidatus Parcubacteria bacterium]
KGLMETIDTGLRELIETRGKRTAAAVTKAHRQAIDLIETIARNEHIECEFKRAPVHRYAETADELHSLEEEERAGKTLGVTLSLGRKNLFFPFQTLGILTVERQAKFHPMKFLSPVAAIAAEEGVRIFERSAARRVSVLPSGDKSVHTEQGSVAARHLLVATHYPLPRQPLSLFFKKGRYLTYVLEAELPKGTLPEAMYEDLKVPYHYARLDTGETADRLIVGGEDHRADIPLPEGKGFTALEAYLKDLLPSVPYSVKRRWKGPIIESGDGLALIGPVEKEGAFYATGHSGNGITYAAIAAELFHDHVLGKENPFDGLFAADRPFTARTYLPSALHYLQEFWNGAVKNLLQH